MSEDQLSKEEQVAVTELAYECFLHILAIRAVLKETGVSDEDFNRHLERIRARTDAELSSRAARSRSKTILDMLERFDGPKQ
jgi:hypothetical protein